MAASKTRTTRARPARTTTAASKQKIAAPWKASGKVDSIDAYLAGVSGERLAALQQLRQTIRAILPRAEECISYGLPAFRADGEVLAGFAATSKGCSYYPFSSATLATLGSELSDYVTTKGALQFDAKKPLPTALVRKLIKTRRAEL
ncbi:MAG: hypothetical protein K0R38_4744 [Polyangiaceae bacterium]|jgi:uncharacterized protein YdhG (YjbR/CyaY superfamily)|nr:hypothetical protein [Polyangiaceae bacterium]